MKIPTPIKHKASEIKLNQSHLDVPYWALRSNGLFSTQSTRKILQTKEEPDNMYAFHWIWTLNTLPKMKNFSLFMFP